MREIKFRGLSDNPDGTKEFVYGDLRHDKPNDTLYYKTHSQRICWHDGSTDYNKPVINGTVGEYTGLKDNNGKEIYEGDKLLYVEELEGEYVCGQNDIILKVIWEDDGWYLMSDCDAFGGKFEEFDELEIIGSIHDKKEAENDTE